MGDRRGLNRRGPHLPNNDVWLDYFYETNRTVGGTNHGNAPIGVAYTSVQSSMFRWRRDTLPPTPNSISSYARILNKETWNHLLVYTEGTVHSQLITGIDLSNALVLVDLQFAPSVCEGGEFFLHTSSKPVPQSMEAQQLLTFMGVKNGRVFPCVWVLMDSKSEPCYKSVMQYLKRESLGLQIRKAITLSDEALEKCVRHEFPTAEIHRSLFFQYEEIYKKVVELNLQNYLLGDNDDVKRLMQSLMSLPLLPIDLIEEAFQDLKRNMNPESWEIVQDLYNYYETHWMDMVGPDKFTVYGKIDCISDVIETYNNRLEMKMGTNPTIWKFTKSLISLQRRVWYDHKRTVEGYRGGIQSPTVAKRGKDGRIKRAWSGLKAPRGRLTTQEFLEQASYICVVPALDHIIIYCQGDINQVDNVRDANSEDDFVEEADLVAEEDVNPVHFLQEFMEEDEVQQEVEAHQLNENRGPREEEVRPEMWPDHEDVNLEPVNPEEPLREEPVQNDIGDVHECCICRVNQRTHAFIPCGHQAICSVCIDVYRNINQKRCPMCRAESTMVIRIYR